MSLTVDRSLRLPHGQYYSRAQPKRAVVLHHTVGGSAKSSFAWWLQDPRVVGTAYLIERDGTIYEVFPPECWAGHLGIKDVEAEKETIGIELASEGALIEKGGDVWAFGAGTGKLLGRADELLKAGRVVRLDIPWRGYQWFDAYDPPQVAAAIALVLELCDRFGIPRRLPLEAANGKADVRRWIGYRGVLHHAMVRKDKSDLHPRFPWRELARALADPAWSAVA